jgi:hypothetical protein
LQIRAGRRVMAMAKIERNGRLLRSRGYWRLPTGTEGQIPNTSIRPEDSATSFTIRYRRPDLPGCLARVTVPNGEDATRVQKARLEALGYSVMDVIPSAAPHSTQT